MAPSEGMGWARSPRLLQHTHTHIYISIPPVPAFYVSVTAIYWLAGFYYINNNLPPKSVWQRERERDKERERPGGGNGELHNFLKRVHIAKLCHHLTRVHCHGNTGSDASNVCFTLPQVISLILVMGGITSHRAKHNLTYLQRFRT